MRLYKLLTSIPIVDFPHPLFYDRLDSLRGELCLRNAAVIVRVNPGNCIWKMSLNFLRSCSCWVASSRVKGLEVLKVLPQGPQKQPELHELDVIRSILAVPIALVLGVVEGPVNGRFAIEDLLAFQHIPNSSLYLQKDQYITLLVFLFPLRIPRPRRDNRSHLGQSQKRVSFSSFWLRLSARKEASILLHPNRFSTS